MRLVTVTCIHILNVLAPLLVFVSPTIALLSAQPGLNTSQIASVRARLVDSANKSWELGTAAEALLELEWPELSVYGRKPLPPPLQLNKTNNASDVLNIAWQTLITRPVDSLTLIEDGAVGDPASVGVAVLLANWTRVNTDFNNYSTAAGEELGYLLHNAPRGSDGAISHRSEYVQLWSDFVYMVPPFISYFGALQGGDEGKGLLQEAFNQVSLYRNNLQDQSSGLWRHVVQGPWQDDGLWATGNGWAAAGMLRVLQTIRNSDAAHDLQFEQDNLTNWVGEIVSAAWGYQQESGSLCNYFSDPASFEDSSSTALIASTTYRLATITNDTTYISSADRAFAVVQSRINQEGYLEDVVDPYNFGNAGTISPEGQAFVLLLQAAWKDYQQWANGTNVDK